VVGIFSLARVWRALLFVGLTLLALPVASAQADTTVGRTGGTAPCEPLGLPGVAGSTFADTNYVVPAPGTITSFSVFNMSPFGNRGPTPHEDFLVLRPVSGSAYTVVGKTGLVTPAGTGLETFDANIPVRAGDILGLWSDSFGLSNCFFSVASGGGVIADGDVSDPSDGDTVDLLFSIPTADLSESANLAPLPTSKSQCLNAGWENFGSLFNNQGDCVSFVASGGKNQPTG
jgi:hypothetical protein